MNCLSSLRMGISEPLGEPNRGGKGAWGRGRGMGAGKGDGGREGGWGQGRGMGAEG